MFYNQFDVWLDPNTGAVEVQQWHDEQPSWKTTDVHFVDDVQRPAVRTLLNRLGFHVRGEWRKSWARPGQWHAILDRIEVNR